MSHDTFRAHIQATEIAYLLNYLLEWPRLYLVSVQKKRKLKIAEAVKFTPAEELNNWEWQMTVVIKVQSEAIREWWRSSRKKGEK
jgi:hypothetical protein